MTLSAPWSGLALVSINLEPAIITLEGSVGGVLAMDLLWLSVINLSNSPSSFAEPAWLMGFKCLLKLSLGFIPPMIRIPPEPIDPGPVDGEVVQTYKKEKKYG